MSVAELPILIPDDEAVVGPTPHRWALTDYLRLAEVGLLTGRTELIDGSILDMPAQGLPHSICISKTVRELVPRLSKQHLILIQSTAAFDDWSGPEPDIAIFPSYPSAAAVTLPKPPLLIVEVSLTILKYDREYKGSFYAGHGLQDYWVINLAERVVEVYRQPVTDATAKFGWRYGSPIRVPSTGKLSPLMLPSQEILVADILP
jgi:Uma2 family endonuclease